MPGAFDVIRRELPKFLEEPHAQDFVNTVSAFVPTTAEDVGLSLALGPLSRLRPVGAAIAAAAPQEAEAGFVGQLAKTANKHLLPEAIDMLKRGVDNATVWMKTGWFRSPDGQMRTEIPDTNLQFRQPFEELAFNPMKPERRPPEMTLSDAVQHPELEAAYPDLFGKYRIGELRKTPSWSRRGDSE